MKNIIVTAFIVMSLGAGIAFAVSQLKPREAQANRCTLSEVKVCYAGQNNGCCPNPKGKPQQTTP